MVKKALLCLTGLLALVPPTASAQSAADRLGPSFKIPVSAAPLVRQPDVDRDSANNVYLAVTGNGGIRGVFLNASGAAVSGQFVINQVPANYAAAPRVTYSAAA